MAKKENLKAVKPEKKGKTPKPLFHVPEGWYLMASDEIGVKEIRKALEGENLDLQYWEEAGVIEIVLGEKSSLDIEEISVEFADDFSKNFVIDYGIKTGCYLTVKPEDYDKVEPIFRKLTQTLNCMICGDTEDFMPIIK